MMLCQHICGEAPGLVYVLLHPSRDLKFASSCQCRRQNIPELQHIRSTDPKPSNISDSFNPQPPYHCHCHGHHRHYHYRCQYHYNYLYLYHCRCRCYCYFYCYHYYHYH